EVERINEPLGRRKDPRAIPRLEHGGEEPGVALELRAQRPRQPVGLGACGFAVRDPSERLVRLLDQEPRAEGLYGEVEVVARLAQADVEAVVRRDLGAAFTDASAVMFEDAVSLPPVRVVAAAQALGTRIEQLRV